MELIQGSEEWLKYRKTSIGASDVAAILGISPWKTPYSLWKDKCNIEEQERTYAMKRGIALEEEARLKFQEIIGKTVSPKVVFHPQYPFLMASLDGISKNGEIIVEIKVPNVTTHKKAINGIIEPYYNCQMQMQMACTGLSVCHYFSFDGEDGAIVIVNRDQDLIDHIIQKCKDFYYNHMLACNPPELTERDYVDFTDNEKWDNLENQYIEICEQIEYMSTIKDTIRKQMHELAKESNVRGKNLKLTKVMTKGRIMYDEIEELKSMDLEKYRRPMMENIRITMVK